MQTSVPDEGNLRTTPGGLKGTASIISPAAQPRRTWRSIAHTDRSRHAAGISTAAKLATAPQVAGFEHLRRAGFEKAQPVSVLHLHAEGKTPSRSARYHYCSHAHDMDRSGLWAGLAPCTGGLPKARVWWQRTGHCLGEWNSQPRGRADAEQGGQDLVARNLGTRWSEEGMRFQTGRWWARGSDPRQAHILHACAGLGAILRPCLRASEATG